MIDAIQAARPDAQVNLVAHSLGARVALTALETAPRDVVRRMILISGAEYRARAETRAPLAGGRCGCACSTSPAARTRPST